MPRRTVAVSGTGGGAGATFTACLLARLTASEGSALVDLRDPGGSSAPHFLGLGERRTPDLRRLAAYRGRLDAALASGYFATSPEGAAYAPLTGEGEGVAPSPPEALALLAEDPPGLFQNLFLDLSPLPPTEALRAGSKAQFHLWVCRLDPEGLRAARALEGLLLREGADPGRHRLLFRETGEPGTTRLDPASVSRIFGTARLPRIPPADLQALREPAGLPGRLRSLAGSLLELLPKTPSAPLQPPSPSSGEPDPFDPRFLDKVRLLHLQLLEELRSCGALAEGADPAAARESLEPKARDLLLRLPALSAVEPSEREALRRAVLATAFGLGPLETFLADTSITEVLVNGPLRVYVEREGRLERTRARFRDEEQLRTAMERILAPLGRRLDESRPYVDARLPDGSRVNAVIPPLSLEGPLLTVRKFPGRRPTLRDLVQNESLTEEAAGFLSACVRARLNLVVSGGTGSGKTTLLNVLSEAIPEEERIVTLEDSAELRLSQEHVVRLEARPANAEGRGQISLRDLVANALRMRPDRIVVGEVRGGEALDMLQAMNTGHDGSLTTLHANSPRDALARLETLCLMAGVDLPLRAVREQVARAVHLVVQVSRLPGGRRGVVEITEVRGLEGDRIVLQELFSREGGRLVRRPFAPGCLARLQEAGYSWPKNTEAPARNTDTHR